MFLNKYEDKIETVVSILNTDTFFAVHLYISKLDNNEFNIDFVNINGACGADYNLLRTELFTS